LLWRARREKEPMLITCEPMKDAGLAKLVIDTYGKYFRNIKKVAMITLHIYWQLEFQS
jgi:hypothetical protein